MDTYWYQLKQTEQNPVYGIYAKGNLNIWQRYKEGTSYYGNIEIYLNKNTTKVAKAPSCYGIYCGGNLTIGSGYIDVDSGISTSADGQSTGIYAKSITVNRGVIAATGYFGADENHVGKSYGIVTEDGVKVNEGTYAVFGVGMDKGIIGSFATELEGSKYESYTSISSRIASNSEARYNAVRESYMLKNLTDSTKVEIGNYAALTEDAVVVAVDELDITTVNGFTSKVKAINPNSITYPESKETVEELQDAYNDLTSAQKKMVADNIIDAYQNILDHYIADKTTDFINEIDNVSLQPEDVEKIKKAKDLYVNLTPDQKALIPDNVKDAFDDVLEEYYELITEEITNKVNDIGEVEYNDRTKEKIDTAKDAYDALTDDEKAAIPQNIKDKLDEAVRKYEKMEDDATRKKVEDKDTGVSIETDGSVGIPRYIELRIEIKSEVTTKEGVIDEAKIQQALGKNQRIVKVFSVKLIQTIDGVETEIQPSDIKEGMKIKVCMVVPENMATKGMSILHIHNDGTIDTINEVQVKDGVAIVEVASLSEFAFAEDLNEAAKSASHGFCVGWIVFIFVILELLATCLYAIIRFGLLKELVAKCKLDCLYDKLDLMTFIGLCVAGGIFLFAFIALCCHQCALTIIMFILALIICCAFAYFFLKDKGFIDKWIKQCKEYLDKKKVKDEVKDEPQPKVEEQKEESKAEEAIAKTEEEAEKELESEKDDTIEEIEAKEKSHEALTLKDSLVLAKATNSSHQFSKKFIANYLRTKDIVEVNERENYTKTGLPLADTHYVDGKDGKKCFAYVYETEGSIILLAKMDENYAEKLQQKHSQINKSAFPKQKNTWYSLILDDTYTAKEVEGILDELIGEVKEDAGMSLKESIALAKANTSHSFSKQYVCDYLKDKPNIEVNTRENYTKTGLPLADTHYVEKDGKKIFFEYIYEIEGTIILLGKMNTKYANSLKKKHPNVTLSAFPKQADTWYSLIIDDTYTKEDLDTVIDDLIEQA